MQAISADGVVHEFPDETDPTVIDRVMKAYALQQQPAPSQPDAPMPSRTVPAPDQALRDAPPPSRASALLRSLQVGTQGAGAGVAELVSIPFDLAAGAQNLATTGINKVFGTNIPMAKPASSILKDAAGSTMEAVGVPPIQYDDMSGQEKLGYNINRFGTQTAGAVPVLASRASTRAAEIATGSTPKLLDSLVRPYAGENIGRTVTGDAFASAGAGTAVTGADLAGYQDNPYVQMLAPLVGGVGGMTIPQTGERALRSGANFIGKPFGYGIDKSINVDPVTGQSITKAVSDRASAMVQDEAVDAPSALTRMVGNQSELRALTPDAPMPSPAALSEDTGLATLERRVNLANQGEAASRNRDFNTSVRDTVDRIAPPGSDPSALVNRVQSVADDMTAEAARKVEMAKGREAKVADIRQGDAQDVAPYAGRGVPASQRLDKTIVDEGYIPERARKNAMFDNAPGAKEKLPADDVFEAAATVRAQNNKLRPDSQLPEEFIRRLEALAPDVRSETVTSPIADQFGRPVTRNVETNYGGEGKALGGELADTRKYIGTAIEKARTSGNFDLADSLGALSRAINRTIEAAPGYAEANANYQGFKETYRPSPNDPAAKFTRSIDRDPGRGSTPPSETAGRFLQPQAPEKQAALRRMVDESATPEAGQAAAREYLMADLEASGVIDRASGALRSDKLQAWQSKWGNVDTVVPGFNQELTAMTTRAAKGERVAGMAAERSKAAETNVKRTQSEIDKGAFGKVLEADPDKAVAAVMSQPHSSGRQLGELIRVTEGNEAARNGLKAAVRDYIVDKATTNASQNLAAGDRRGPVSLDKLSRVFNEHERELAQIFNAEEMNTLRAGHRALDLAAKAERTRVSSGSDTAEKASLVDKMLGTGLGKGVEAALRLKYGMLKAGGVIATARRLTAGVTGGPSNDDVLRLVERAAVDPELMGLLLGRKLPVASPAWNSKMQRLLAVSEGARDTAPDDQ